MPLNLMYITNRTDVAKIAESSGVDRIFIDMEYIGKDERQSGMDTVKSHHTIMDLSKIRKAITKSEILVRINPIHERTNDYESSKVEIEKVIDAGADIIMLPMYKTIDEVENFIKYVNGRAKVMLLAETVEACNLMDRVLKINEIDEMHIGLNDLHLALKKKFMFELLADGTIDHLCSEINKSNKPFGFGGIARIGYGLLPAEYVIGEHYRLHSTRAILSRAFCNVDKMNNIEEIQKVFQDELIKIRVKEKECVMYSNKDFENNKNAVKRIVKNIVSNM